MFFVRPVTVPTVDPAAALQAASAAGIAVVAAPLTTPDGAKEIARYIPKPVDRPYVVAVGQRGVCTLAPAGAPVPTVVETAASGRSGSPLRVGAAAASAVPSFAIETHGVIDAVPPADTGGLAMGLGGTAGPAGGATAAAAAASSLAGAVSAASSDAVAAAAASGLTALCARVAAAAQRRDSLFLVNRGSQFAGKSAFFVGAVDRALHAALPAADSALQILADEAAKERQMQRILGADPDAPNTAGGGGGAKGGDGGAGGAAGPGAALDANARGGVGSGSASGAAAATGSPGRGAGAAGVAAASGGRPGKLLPAEAFAGFAQTRALLRAQRPQSPQPPGSVGGGGLWTPSRPGTASTRPQTADANGGAAAESPRSRFAVLSARSPRAIDIADGGQNALTARALRSVGVAGNGGGGGGGPVPQPPAVGRGGFIGGAAKRRGTAPTAAGGGGGGGGGAASAAGGAAATFEPRPPTILFSGDGGEDAAAGGASPPPAAAGGGRRRTLVLERRSSAVLLGQLRRHGGVGSGGSGSGDGSGGSDGDGGDGQGVGAVVSSAKDLRHNGWPAHETGAFSYFALSGRDSYISLPGIPNLDSLIGCCVIDFWLKTACKAAHGRQTILHVSDGGRPEVGMQLQIGLNWYSDLEQGAGETLRVFVRDASNRVFEAILALHDPSLTSGDAFHHYSIAIRSLEEGLIDVLIDGRPRDRVRFMQAEHPNTFNSWAGHRLFLGGFVNELGTVVAPLKGALVDLRVSKYAGRQQPAPPVVRWPLIATPEAPRRHNGNDDDGGGDTDGDPDGGERPAARGGSGSGSRGGGGGGGGGGAHASSAPAVQELSSALRLEEATKTVASDSHTKVVGAAVVTEPTVPEVCPVFDGRTAVSLGPVGPLGALLHHFSVELRFRTQILNKPMALIGVTDPQHKMPTFSIVLNAEPSLGGERFKHREYNMTVVLSDASGKCLSVLVPFNERTHLSDDRWHTVLCKVVDSETNKIEVRVDGKAHDTLVTVGEGPKTFLPFRQSVYVGSHNRRGQGAKTPFLGLMKRCVISARGQALCDFSFGEGPGAMIAVDATGHSLHGMYIDPVTGASCRHRLVWVPSSDEGDRAEGADPAGDDAIVPSAVLHKNNAVRFALLLFGTKATASVVAEECLDALHGFRPVTFDSRPSEIGERRGAVDARGKRRWALIPDACFVAAETAAIMHDHAVTALARVTESRPAAHVLLVLAIGDATISFLDLRGPRLPLAACYDSNMLRWKAPLSTFGLENKRSHLLNNVVVAVERCLADLTCAPTLVKRLRYEDVNPRLGTDGLIRACGTAGLPHSLACVVLALVLNVEFRSDVVHVASVWNPCREGDAAALASFRLALRRAAHAPAALLLQRNFRAWAARRRSRRVRELIAARVQRIEAAAALRRTSPHVTPKATLRALLVTCFDFDACGLRSREPQWWAEVGDVAAALEEQGYQVERLRSPTRAALLAALQTGVNAMAMTFVGVWGFGGALPLRPPAPSAVERLALATTEGRDRQEVSLLACGGLDRLRLEFERDAADIRAAAEAKQRKKKPSKAQLAAQAANTKRAEDASKAGRELVEHEEKEARALGLVRDQDNEFAAIVLECRQLVVATTDFERRFGGGRTVDAIFTRESPTFLPRADGAAQATTLQELAALVLKQPMPPMGFQAVFMADLAPIGAGTTGLSLVAASTGHAYRFRQRPEQRGVLTWHLRKALRGHARPLPRRKDAALYGGADCGADQRDWRSFGQYLFEKMAAACGPQDPSLQGESGREVPYTADVVPVRRGAPGGAAAAAVLEARAKARKELELRRVTGTALVAVDSDRAGLDLGTELRNSLGEVSIADIAALSVVLLSPADGVSHLEAIDMRWLRAEVQRLLPPGAAAAAVRSASGVQIELSGGDKSKHAAAMNSIATRAKSWRVPLATPPPASGVPRTVEIAHIEFLFLVRGSAGGLRWKRLQRRRCEQPQLTPAIRLLECTAES